MTLQKTQQKNVTFRHGDFDFDVQLEVELKNNKVVSVSDSTSKFFDSLKAFHIVSTNEDICTLLDSEKVTFSLFSDKNSFKVRKKAELLGLKIIPGENFEKKKSNSLKAAFHTCSHINNMATN